MKIALLGLASLFCLAAPAFSQTNDGPPPAKAGPAQKAEGAEAAKGCAYKEESFGNGSYKAAELGGWTIFLSRDDGHSNNFLLCIGKTTLGVMGVPEGKNAIRTDSATGDLVIEAFQPSEFIRPEDIIGGRAAGAEFKSAKGSKLAEVAERFTHYIHGGDATPEGLAALAQGKTAITIDKVAWATFAIDPQTKEAENAQVHLRKIDGKDARQSVADALGIGSAKASAFSGDADKKKILDFVEHEIARYKGDTLLTKDPKVIVYLNIAKEASASVRPPATVVAVFTAAKKIGDRDGEPILSAKCHDELKYCTYPDKEHGNAPYGLETLTAHRKHMGIKDPVCPQE